MTVKDPTGILDASRVKTYLLYSMYPLMKLYGKNAMPDPTVRPPSRCYDNVFMRFSHVMPFLKWLKYAVFYSVFLFAAPHGTVLAPVILSI